MAVKREVTGRARPKARRGRPTVHEEAWSKVSVVLFDRQIRRLDRLAHDLRDGGATAMTRACIIRALIDGLFESTVDIKDVYSEAELRSRVARSIQSGWR
jgi:hypothetical protein